MRRTLSKISPTSRRPASPPGASYLSPGRSPGNSAPHIAHALKGQPNADLQSAAGWPGAIPGLRPGLRHGPLGLRFGLAARPVRAKLPPCCQPVNRILLRPPSGRHDERDL